MSPQPADIAVDQRGVGTSMVRQVTRLLDSVFSIFSNMKGKGMASTGKLSHQKGETNGTVKSHFDSLYLLYFLRCEPFP